MAITQDYILKGGLRSSDEAANNRLQAIHKMEQQKQQQPFDAEKSEKDRENARLMHSGTLMENERHNREMERIGSQGANTTEGYRRDQAKKMEEDARSAKLKLLIGGPAGDGKVGAEQQKVINLSDSARSSLNETERLAKENPKTAATQTALQSIPLVGDGLSNFLSGLAGGKFKEVRDSKAHTKEAMQNLYTGAAASGEQVPAFQGFSGPGALDILQGNTDTSGNTRDAINTLQQRQRKAQPRLNQEMLDVSGMGQDPIAQQALKQQTEAAQAALAQRISRMSPQEQEIYREVMRNPSHPNAAKAKQDLERRHGRLD